MAKQSNELWIFIGGAELKEFAQIVKTIEETNIFPCVLAEDNYTKLDEFTYQKGDNHLIKIYHHEGKWKYQNLKKPEDRGSIVQFIANRWSTEGIEITRSMATVLIAARIAKSYYHLHIKDLKKKYEGMQRASRLLEKMKTVQEGNRNRAIRQIKH